MASAADENEGWRGERQRMRERLRQLADLVHRETTRREADVEQLEVRLAAEGAENARLRRELARLSAAGGQAEHAARAEVAAAERRALAAWEEAEREAAERLAAEAEARQEAEDRADLALRRQLELERLLADQADEAALILAEAHAHREQLEAERRGRLAQQATHERQLTELAARWEKRLALERGALERERLRLTAEKHRQSAEERAQLDEQQRARRGASGARLGHAVESGRTYAQSILRKVERQVEERHTAEAEAAAPVIQPKSSLPQPEPQPEPEPEPEPQPEPEPR